MNKLDKIFKMQEKLNCLIGINLAHLSHDEKVKWILNYSRELQQEVSELIDSVSGSGGQNNKI